MNYQKLSDHLCLLRNSHCRLQICKRGSCSFKVFQNKKISLHFNCMVAPFGDHWRGQHRWQRASFKMVSTLFHKVINWLVVYGTIPVSNSLSTHVVYCLWKKIKCSYNSLHAVFKYWNSLTFFIFIAGPDSPAWTVLWMFLCFASLNNYFKNRTWTWNKIKNLKYFVSVMHSFVAPITRSSYINAHNTFISVLGCQG